MMPEPSILVTTIIPTHNRAALLAEAIESVRSQSLDGGHQIIVVDDSSTDNTAQVVGCYPDIEYIDVSSGNASGTRNAGMKLAKGRYIAFLDDDDVWLPNRFPEFLAILDSNPNVGMVYAQAALATHDLKERSTLWPPEPLGQGHPILEFLTDVVPLISTIIRRSVLEDVGLLDEQVSSAEDMDFVVRIARRYQVVGLPRVVALTRMRDPSLPENIDGAAAHWIKRSKDDLRLLAHHCSVDDPYRPSPQKASALLRKRRGWYSFMLLSTARTAMKQGNKSEARAAAKAAVELSPLHALRSWAFYRALLPG